MYIIYKVVRWFIKYGYDLYIGCFRTILVQTAPHTPGVLFV